jgi:hypothetical protein
MNEPRMWSVQADWEQEVTKLVALKDTSTHIEINSKSRLIWTVCEQCRLLGDRLRVLKAELEVKTDDLVVVVGERDNARTERDALKQECDRLTVENNGMSIRGVSIKPETVASVLLSTVTTRMATTIGGGTTVGNQVGLDKNVDIRSVQAFSDCVAKFNGGAGSRVEEWIFKVEDAAFLGNITMSPLWPVIYITGLVIFNSNYKN